MILTFSKTTDAFLSGNKTQTRRVWKDRHFKTWLMQSRNIEKLHDAYDKTQRNGGKKIGKFLLTARPKKQYIRDMSWSDLECECCGCSTIEQYCKFTGYTPDTLVTVIEFERME